MLYVNVAMVPVYWCVPDVPSKNQQFLIMTRPVNPLNVLGRGGSIIAERFGEDARERGKELEEKPGLHYTAARRLVNGDAMSPWIA